LHNAGNTTNSDDNELSKLRRGDLFRAFYSISREEIHEILMQLGFGDVGTDWLESVFVGGVSNLNQLAIWC
jgi:hypothetical protein